MKRPRQLLTYTSSSPLFGFLPPIYRVFVRFNPQTRDGNVYLALRGRGAVQRHGQLLTYTSVVTSVWVSTANLPCVCAFQSFTNSGPQPGASTWSRAKVRIRGTPWFGETVTPHRAFVENPFVSNLCLPSRAVSRIGLTGCVSLYSNLDDNDEPEDIDEQDDDDMDSESGDTPEELDWRDFRARLVLEQKRVSQESEESKQKRIEPPPTAYSDLIREVSSRSRRSNPKSTNTDTDIDTDTTSWAYECGTGGPIEVGSLLISQPTQKFGFGLSQQYFHKCLILILHHEEGTFTKGVILNRPTDLILSDDDFVNADGSALDPIRNSLV
eukprot:CAMPEP_0194446926 /NCGR_PEP_ID=MMETSP0176-20130528/128719_1 /TAXON_ID=216777 /ORGANISM="Proboscia alata, Strain PI-D3" /LENGTH=325 /DNA_ID=CAMNT_0039273711 /DNA_START=151 /DNA_END=1126 /DNA_ORIENTATION=-